MTEYETWQEEMRQRRAKLERQARRAEERKAIDELPTLSQRVIARILFTFGG